MNLKERLSLIQAGKGKMPNTKRISRSFPSEWCPAAPFVWTRIVDMPFAHVPDAFLPHLMRPQTDHHEKMRLESRSMDRAVFFDLETTGLSGGSGTIAFLSTVARFEGRNLILRQTFLEDYPGEPDFLRTVVAQLEEGEWIVSYNGAAFDTPLLQGRCVVNRIPAPLFKQIDILHDCRRFWSTAADSCTLGSMESLLLRKHREDDIPGSLVPRVWLDYVKANVVREEQASLMSLVWRHNLQDVASLAELFLLIEAVYRNPSGALVRYGVDPAGLAASLSKTGRYDEAKIILLKVRDEKEARESAGVSRMRALRLLASMARREGDGALFAQTVLSMDEDSLYGCIAKAKLFEHAAKDPRAALDWARRAEHLAEKDAGSTRGAAISRDTAIDAIRHRISRLEKKIERAAPRPAAQPQSRTWSVSPS